VIAEIDWSVGQVVAALQDEGLTQNTLVIFTSDNGPWLTFQQQGGSAGLLRGGKGSTWEGGMRVPLIARWPGTIEPAMISDIGCTLDLFATISSLAGLKLPTDRTMDSLDLSGAFTRGQASRRDTMLFYRDEQLYAVRKGPWKAHFTTQPGYGGKPERHGKPLLFHLGHDPGESYNRAAEHPRIIEELQQIVDEHRRTIEPVKNQLAR